MQRYTIYQGKVLKASKGDWVEWAEVLNALQEVMSCPCRKCTKTVKAVVDYQFFTGINENEKSE